MATQSIEHTRNRMVFSVDHRLMTTSCWCGIKFAIPENLYDYMHAGPRRECFCPMGHTMVFGNTDLDRAKEEAERQRSRAEYQAAQAKRERASKIAYKGQATRARKRHAAGVCPCCKRSFKQLREHMTRMHPDYDPTLA